MRVGEQGEGCKSVRRGLTKGRKRYTKDWLCITKDPTVNLRDQG